MHEMIEVNKSDRPLAPFDQITHREPQGHRRRYQEGVAGFMRAMQEQRDKFYLSKKRRLYNLSKLGDPSFQYPHPPQHVIFDFLMQLDSKYPVLKPESVFVVLWNIFMIIAMLFNFFEIPIALFMTDRVYEFETENSLPLAFNLIFLIGLMLDNLVVRFNLAFYRSGKLITPRQLIFKKYIKFSFWVDMISWMVLFVYIVGGDPNLVYLKFVFYLKVISFITIDQEVLDWFSIHPVRFALYRLSRTIMVMWFFTTWVSSIYFAIDYAYYKEKGFYYQTGQLWLTNSNLIDNLNMVESFPWYIWYEYAVYWSLQTSSTVGYGNITPRNPQEVLYCDFIIVLNTLLFAYYMNTIWEVIGELQESSERYSNNWADLKGLMKKEKIPHELHKRVGDFLEEIWIEEDQDIAEEELTNMLSENLQAELFLSVRSPFFSRIPFFQQFNLLDHNKDYFAKELVYLLKERNVGKDTVIYQHGDDDQNLYYMLRGTLQIAIPSLNTQQEVCINDNFGFEQFLSEQLRFCTATAFTFCRLWYLKRRDFLQTIKNYLPLYEQYCELKHRALLSKEFQLTGVSCLKCKKTTHSIRTCETVNLWRKEMVKPSLYSLRIVKREGFAYRKKRERVGKVKSMKMHGVSYERRIKDCEKVCRMSEYHSNYNL